MRIMKPLALLVCVWAGAVSTAYADVRMSMANGRVSIVATDATVRQILTEWARVGQTQIVNVERIPGGPVTLELNNVPEDQALDLLLRSVSGYLAAPRPMTVANASRFDRIIVMPTSAAPRLPAPAGFVQPAPPYNAIPQPADEDAEDERPAPNVVMPTPNPRGPVFNAFPQPQVVNPQGMPPGGFLPPQMTPTPAPQTPATYPGAPTAPPGSVTTPGMVAPMPLQPGQPGAPVQLPGQPGAPARRPGGPGAQ
jgi:hypothetical protein